MSSVYGDAISMVCKTVSARIFEKPDGLTKWSKECLSLSDQVSAFRHKSHVVNLLAEKLDELQMSHLGIYVPSETRQLWTGESRDTGLRGRFIETQFVISEVLKGSSAEQQGVKVGDSLATINGKSVISQWQGQKARGEFVFLRGDNLLTFQIEPEKMQIDEAPTLESVDRGVGRLRISSFRKELWDKLAWSTLAKEGFAKYQSLIVDIRGNPGGSFVAMLRALSPFFCEPHSIGHVIKPRDLATHASRVRKLPDDPSDALQIEIFSENSIVNLETYEDYGCFRGRVVVLIDQETASVAEIFAEAIKHRKKSKVIGAVSSGDVLLGVWYDLSILGRDHSFSVPEALYQNPEGETLERVGVSPDFEVEYKLEEALLGRDSFVLEAVSSLRGDN